MNVKEIKEMVTLMNENNLAELEIEKDGTRIKLKKDGAGSNVSPLASVFIERDKFPGAPEIRVLETSAPKGEAARKMDIKSPMVGTFYRAPGPEAPAFVEIGQNIEPGQVVCIVEAMKLMNEIKSEVKGKIKEILVDNAEPIEFGQSLFIIDPA